MRKYTTRHTEAEVIDAIIKAKGIISNAANILNLTSYQSLRERIKHSPAMSAVLFEQRELLKDTAESVITDSITIDRNVETAKWYLKSMGKDRGYGDSVAISGSINVEHSVDLSKLSGKELEQLEEILRKTESSNSGTSGS